MLYCIVTIIRSKQHLRKLHKQLILEFKADHSILSSSECNWENRRVFSLRLLPGGHHDRQKNWRQNDKFWNHNRWANLTLHLINIDPRCTRWQCKRWGEVRVTEKTTKINSYYLVCLSTGNYGNQIDGISKPSSAKGKKKDGEGDEEESELIQNSSDDDADEDGDLMSVSSTPVMKPVITDRSGPSLSFKNNTDPIVPSVKPPVWSPQELLPPSLLWEETLRLHQKLVAGPKETSLQLEHHGQDCW